LASAAAMTDFRLKGFGKNCDSRSVVSLKSRFSLQPPKTTGTSFNLGIAEHACRNGFPLLTDVMSLSKTT